MKAIIKSLLIVATALFVVGCGGGGVPGGYSGGDKNSLFPSNSHLASPTNNNALSVIDMLLSYNLDNNTPSLRVVSANSTVKKRNSSLATFTISQLKLVKSKIENKNMKAMKVIKDNGECSNGGRYYKNGEITKANGGEVEYEYRKCKTDDGDIYDGIMNVKASNYDYDKEEFTNIDIKYSTDFSVEDDSGRYTILKGSTISTKLLDDGRIEVKTTIVSRKNGDKRGFKDVTFIIENYNEGTLLYQTTGRIYINNLREYVELDKSYDTSETPLEFDSSNSVQNGEVHYLMKSRVLKIIIENGTLDYIIE